MRTRSKPVAIIVGAGPGLSVSLLRRWRIENYAVALAARDPAKPGELAAETGALALGCDATKEREVGQLFEAVEARLGPTDVLIYNAAARVMGPVVDLQAEEVERVILGDAMGGFLSAQAAARAMLPRAAGTISPARRRAPKAIRGRLPSRWAGSPYAGSRRASPARSARPASTSPMS